MEEDKRSWDEVINGVTKEEKEEEIKNNKKIIKKCLGCGKKVYGNYCSYCGKKYEQSFCQNCGKKIDGNYCSYCNQSNNYEDENNDYNSNYCNNESYAGVSIISFFIPLVGLIMYLVYIDSNHSKAVAAIRGFVIRIILYFLAIMFSLLTQI